MNVKVQDSVGVSTTYPIVIDVLNTVPTFTGSLTDQSMVAGSTKNYPIPGTHDAENHPITIAVLFSGSTTLPSWAVFNGTHFVFSPAGTLAACVTSFEIRVSDNIGYTSYSLQVTITANQPPSFDSSLSP